MTAQRTRITEGKALVALAALAAVLLAAPAAAHGDHKAAAPASSGRQAAASGHDHMAGAAGADGMDHGGEVTSRSTHLLMPIMNSRRGRTLFVGKACVTCHAINGVGGHHAPNLDAHTMKPFMNPFDFAAKMWRGAATMIALQEDVMGGQIEFTGEELADIIAFVHDDEEQHLFSEADITPEIRKLMDHKHGPRGGAQAHGEELGHTDGHGEAAPPN